MNRTVYTIGELCDPDQLKRSIRFGACSANGQRVALGVASLTICPVNGAQGQQGLLLRYADAAEAGDIQSFIGAVAAQSPQPRSGGHIPECYRAVVAARREQL